MSNREEVVVVGYAYNLNSGAYSQYPGEDWSPMMMVAQHERIVASLGRSDQTESEHHTRLLGQALGECIAAAGITRPGVTLSGPELLMFAEDLKRHLTEQLDTLKKVRASVTNALGYIDGIRHGENVNPPEMWEACEHLSAALIRINTFTRKD